MAAVAAVACSARELFSSQALAAALAAQPVFPGEPPFLHWRTWRLREMRIPQSARTDSKGKGASLCKPLRFFTGSR